MCVSAATLNLREARQLEWETLSSDNEDELPSSWTGLGLPDGYLDSTEAALTRSTSDNAEAALLPWLSKAHRFAAEVDHQFKQLQLVTCRPQTQHPPCTESTSKGCPLQADTQRRIGKLHAQAQQIQCEELWDLHNIRQDLSDRQVLALLSFEQSLLSNQKRVSASFHRPATVATMHMAFARYFAQTRCDYRRAISTALVPPSMAATPNSVDIGPPFYYAHICCICDQTHSQ